MQRVEHSDAKLNAKRAAASPQARLFLTQALILLGIFVLAALPRLGQLDYFLMVDENLWYERSARFLQGLASGELAQTVQEGHPGVTTMWSGTAGLLLHYARAALPGESPAEFAGRMTSTPATLATLRLLRLPLALLSALTVALAFGLGRRLLGTGPALAGAALLAFEPLFVAHSRVLHHDSPAADFALLAVLGWLLYLKENRRRFLILAGAGVALATLSKISSVFLLGFAGLTLLPALWSQLAGSSRRPTLAEAGSAAWRAVAGPWLKLAGLTALAVLLVWPAVWAAPGAVWTTVFSFIGRESGAHANGTFFLGRPVPDPGLLFYPVSLAFALTPLTLIGFALATVTLGLGWYRRRSLSAGAGSGERWAAWLWLYAVLFILYISLIGKKQERYALPAVVHLNLLAGWGWMKLGSWVLGIRVSNPQSLISNLQSLLLPLALLLGQFAFAWPTAPYYSTFYNPLLGGGAAAEKVVLIGRGEGLEQAVRFIREQSGERIPQVASWYGTTVAVPFEGQVDVKDVSHPHFILSSDYVIFYVNQWQRRLPDETILRYVQGRDAQPLFTVKLAGIDYAHVYRGQAIDHPIDPFLPAHELAGKARLAGFNLAETPVAGAEAPLRLYWLYEGLQPDEHFYVRLADTLEQDWGWGACAPDPAFGPADTWQDGDIIESQCRLVVYPGTPPGPYLLRAGVINQAGVVIGQINLDAAAGTVRVDYPPEFPADEWVPAEHRPAPADQAGLGESVALIGYDYTAAARKPGEVVPLTLYWRAQQAAPGDLAVRFTLAGEGPGQEAVWESAPVNGRHPTSAWRPGEVVRDPWQLTLPASLPGGRYELTLSLIDAAGREAGHLGLGSLEVEGREHAFALAAPPQNPQPAQLGPAIRFLGYDLAGAPPTGGVQPGTDLEIDLIWQALATPERNYTVFVQLLDEANQVRAQHDAQPGGGALITTTWAPGEYVRDAHRLELPPDLPAGRYRLIAGMYLPDSGQRLPVFDAAGQPLGDHLTLDTPLVVP